ncbi:hypothetical protein [Burkholderia ubonensis]|uniref:hypothetical protein n=1 Tax=Burkholderia ubonensis TaxID=101571 RepID=UPI001054AD3D|nr:hypothetical protein [Burkholderia ubonensis]
MRDLLPRPEPRRPLPAAPPAILLAATLLCTPAAAHAHDTGIAASGLRAQLNCSTTARWPLPKERAVLVCLSLTSTVKSERSQT